MNLSISITPETAAWLERKAALERINKQAAAEAVLRAAAAQETAEEPGSNERWQRQFEGWIAKVPARPGPPIDASRESNYD